jgi:hypothetical protein
MYSSLRLPDNGRTFPNSVRRGFPTIHQLTRCKPLQFCLGVTRQEAIPSSYDCLVARIRVQKVKIWSTLNAPTRVHVPSTIARGNKGPRLCASGLRKWRRVLAVIHISRWPFSEGGPSIGIRTPLLCPRAGRPGVSNNKLGVASGLVGHFSMPLNQ